MSTRSSISRPARPCRWALVPTALAWWLSPPDDTPATPCGRWTRGPRGRVLFRLAERLLGALWPLVSGRLAWGQVRIPPSLGNAFGAFAAPRPICMIINMQLSWDEAKRRITLEQRGLDFADAGDVFAGPHQTLPDDRRDYGEPRFITVGFLAGRMVVVVHAPRGDGQRIISMRNANEREQAQYKDPG